MAAEVLTTPIKITKATISHLNEVDFTNIRFGQYFADHMFVADYKDGKWLGAEVMPFKDLTISPACAALHYGQAIFEGLKAYKTQNGQVSIFRPDMNAKRINLSAERLCMPELPDGLFIEGLRHLIDVDRDWVPNKQGTSLYIRPFMFGSEPVVGVRPSREYKFIIFSSPVGAYYADPVKVKVENHFTRSAEGGVGFTKCAGNYGASLRPDETAHQQGFNLLIWTDAKEHRYIEEAGTMNVFFQIGDTLITPSIDKKTTLAGITRDSIITLAKDNNIKVEERQISVDEIIAAARKGILNDAFGAGTAATIAPIKSLTCNDETFELPQVEKREYSNFLKKTLNDIKIGNTPDIHNWLMHI